MRPLGPVVFLVCAACAQENSGQISGVVTDRSGAVVPDARITASSATLPRPLYTKTDYEGRYRFPRVPIGVYSISVSRQGFGTLTQPRLKVKLGAEVVYNAELPLGDVSETVEVNAAAVSLETTSSRTSTNVSREEFENLPRSRDYTSLLPIAPGVRLENRAGGGYGVQVDGASGAENAFIIDGVDVTDMFTGGLRYQYALPLQMLQEVQVKSGGFQPEYGGANGGVVNIATRSGANAWHGSVELQFSNDQLNPRPRGYWQRSPADADQADFFAAREDAWRTLWPGASLSGPILRDRLYFFGAYDPAFTRIERSIPYPAGARQFTATTIQHYGLGRIDFSPAQAWMLTGSWLWAPSRSAGGLPITDTRIPAPRNDQSIVGGFVPSQSFTASASYAPANGVLLSARYGYRYLNLKPNNYGLPETPWLRYINSTSTVRGASVPAEFAGPNGFENVSDPFKITRNIQTRHNVYLDGAWLASVNGRQHAFKAGYALNRVGNDIEDDYPYGRFDIYWGDAFTRGTFPNVRGLYGYYVWEDGVRHSAAVTGHNQGLYAQDSWRVTPTLTINAGVRFENEFLPPYRKEQGGVRIANPVTFGWGAKIAPRLAAAWDVRGDGRWKLAASFGYLFDVMKYELARVSFGGDIWFSNVYRLDSPNVYLLSKANPGALGAKILTYDNRTVPINARGEVDGLDPGLKPYQTRRFIVSLDRQINSRVAAGVRYTHNALVRAVEDIGVLDRDDNEVFLIGNPGYGRTRFDQQHIYDGRTPNGEEFLVPKATREYDSMEFRIHGQVFRALQLTASYTWSRLWGNYSGLANSDESGRSEPGVSAAFNLPYYYFDSSGDQKNKFGRLATDRPHGLKIFSYYTTVTRAGETSLGVNQAAYSGVPDSTSVTYISAPTFPRGRGDLDRTQALIQTDLAVSHVLKTGERTSLRLEVNVLNLFNQAAVISRVTQLNRASAVTETRLPLAKFFSGYDVREFVYPGSRTPPFNPIYGLPGGNYRDGGPGAYQGPRNIRLGVGFTF